MKRLGKIMLRLLLTFVVAGGVTGGAVLAILASPKGLPWLAAGAEKLMPGFSAQKVSGHFFSSWSLEGISYRHGDFAFAMKSFNLRWRGGELRHRTIWLDELTAEGIRLELPAAEEKRESKSSAPFFIPSWLTLRLDKLAITDVQVKSGDRETLLLENCSGGGEASAGAVSLKGWSLTGNMAAPPSAIRFALAVDAALVPAAGADAAISLNSQISLWPERGFAPVTGTLAVHGTLIKPEFSLNLTSPTPLALTGSAVREGQHWRWRGELTGESIDSQSINPQWRPLRLAVTAAATGVDAQYEATATGAVTVPDKGKSRFTLALAGGAEALALRQCRLDGAFGALTAKGDLSWSSGFAWRGEIKAAGFNPAFLAPDYAGAIDAALISDGQIAGPSRTGGVTIQKLSGQVRGYPVAGGGGLHFTGNTLTIDALNLQSGAARLTLAGNIAEQFDIKADIAIPNLGEVLARAGGALQARAKLNGTPQAPKLEASLQASGLTFAGRRLAKVTGDLQGSWATAKPADMTFAGSLQAERLYENDKPLLDFLKLTVNGSPGKHQAELAARAPLGEVAVRLAGGLKEKTWDGALDNLSVVNEKIGRWRQNGAARLTLAAAKGELSGLQLSGGEGSFRLAGRFIDEGQERRWNFALTEGKLPLSLLPPIGDAKKADGSVAFSLDAEGMGARLAGGRFSVRTGYADLPGVAVLPGLQRIHLGETQLAANVRDGSLALEAKSHFNDNHDLAANLTLAAPNGVFDLKNIGGLMRAPLAGHLRLSMGDLNFVGPVSHYTVIPSGAVVGDFSFGGVLAKPSLTGKVTMEENGQVEITSAGIGIKHVEIGAVIEADLVGGENGLDLNLTVNGTSGPGHATAVGVLKFPRVAPFFGDFSLTADNADIFRRPEYRIRANPDVRMFFDRHHGKLTGKVDVTWAEIAPEHFQGHVSASNDLIIVDDDEEDHSGWRFLTDLDIHLGDEVRFSGYGLTGLLHGNLTVKTDQSGNFTGLGALQLADGNFVIYGRRLQMERGRLSFAGGAIDNPLIDARAQKQVLTRGSGVHEIVVGVDVSGSADALQFQLFSNEPFSDREILTYLLSGASVTQDSPDENLLSSAAKALGIDDEANLLGGMGLLDEVSFEQNGNNNSMSLLVGKRLTNDLFIGYDHNFVGEGGTFKIRYNLGRGFTVETSSSGSVSSADLFYSFAK